MEEDKKKRLDSAVENWFNTSHNNEGLILMYFNFILELKNKVKNFFFDLFYNKKANQ
jgi:hypothetical protein